MKHFLKMKKVISALVVMLILFLTACANATGTGQSSAGTDGTESADTEARSDFNKNSSQDSEELTNIRVTFDIEKMKDGLLERYEQLYSSEETVNVLKAISKAQNENPYLDFNKKIVHGYFKEQMISVLESHCIAVDTDNITFGSYYPHLTFAKTDKATVEALASDETVISVNRLEDERTVSLPEESVKKINDVSCTGEFKTLLEEAGPDDLLDVFICFDFLYDVERNTEYSDELEKIADAYAAEEVGYTLDDIERLVREASVIDEEHGISNYSPTEDQDTLIREMIDNYRHVRNQFIFSETYSEIKKSLSEDEMKIRDERFEEFSEEFHLSDYADLKMSPSSLSGKIRAQDIISLLERDDVRSVSYEQPLTGYNPEARTFP